MSRRRCRYSNASEKIYPVDFQKENDLILQKSFFSNSSANTLKSDRYEFFKQNLRNKQRVSKPHTIQNHKGIFKDFLKVND